ncbi:methyltransferase [Catenovulum sp. SM1970]|uniref:methyltransferase n=1 Tax=Marinifaba aquimaris TaxID=2741323 RepID=UPI001574BAC7|nr:methyltransferase [Marinifaba aquimaris]
MQTPTSFETPLSINNENSSTQEDTRTLTLWRYPKQADDSPLQAWDTADALLLNTIKVYLTKQIKISIINDGFGALTTSLLAANHKLSSYTDSKVSALASIQNCQVNQLDSKAVTFLPKLNPDEISDSLIIAKLPKNLAFLEFILKQLNQVTKAIDIVFSAKANDINASVKKLFSRYFEVVDISLAWKKSRTITLSKPVAKPYSQFNYWQATDTKSLGISLYNAPNVFARGKLDIGAAFFIEHLPNAENKKVVDLACGNGVLSLVLAKHNPDISHLTLVDESQMAVESASYNFEKNALTVPSLAFKQNDCLSEFEPESVDIVICNPPFHQQKTITDHIAWQMFKDAKRILKKGGELRIVGNRHLGYHIKLNKLFNHCQQIASNSKFVVLSTVKN